MNTPKVSIVAIVYNVEPYLRQCLTSLCNQTLKDIEIIIVYDKSTDNSLEIIKEFEQKDPRIKVIIREQKAGPASARNQGIRMTRGEYVGFADTDDFVELDMFEILYNKAKQFDAEISFCCGNVLNAQTDKIIQFPWFNLPEKFQNISFNENDIRNYLFKFRVFFWNKIYKRDFLFNNNIFFPEGMVYDDDPFFYNCFTLADKIVCSDKKLYNYRLLRPGSTVENRGKMFFDIFKVMDTTENILKTNGVFQKYKQDFFEHKIDLLFYNFKNIKGNFKKEFFYKMLEEFKKMNIDEMEKRSCKYIRIFDEPKKVINSGFYWLYNLKALLSRFFSIKKTGRKFEIIFFNYSLNILLKNRDNDIKPLTKEEIEKLLKKMNFQNKINKLAKKYKNKRILIYGGGLLFSVISRNYDLSGLNIVAVADKSVADNSTNIENYKAIPLEELKNISAFDVIMISILKSGSVKNMLLNGLYFQYKTPPEIISLI